MSEVRELEQKLARAKAKEALANKQCASCSGKGWICDTTYDRTGVDVGCGRCYGTGLPAGRVQDIIHAALKPFHKPVGK